MVWFLPYLIATSFARLRTASSLIAGGYLYVPWCKWALAGRWASGFHGKILPKLHERSCPALGPYELGWFTSFLAWQPNWFVKPTWVCLKIVYP